MVEEMKELRAQDLLDAIIEVEKSCIRRNHMVILAPLGTMAAILHREPGWHGTAHVLYYKVPWSPPEFGGVLIVEDTMHEKVVVKSLVSEHRVVLPVPSPADRICGLLAQCEETTVHNNLKRQVPRRDSLEEWPCETCYRCGDRNVIGFEIEDDIWMEVVGDPDVVLCPSCFDRAAQDKGVRYEFLRLHPVSWNEALRPPGGKD